MIPQLVMIGLLLFQIGVDAERHGKPKNRNAQFRDDNNCDRNNRWLAMVGRILGTTAKIAVMAHNVKVPRSFEHYQNIKGAKN